MSILPEGDDLRNAIKWIDEMLQDKTDKSISDLISEASLKFDLPPNDQEFFIQEFLQKRINDVRVQVSEKHISVLTPDT